jgi:hypothetical protein
MATWYKVVVAMTRRHWWWRDGKREEDGGWSRRRRGRGAASSGGRNIHDIFEVAKAVGVQDNLVTQCKWALQAPKWVSV